MWFQPGRLISPASQPEQITALLPVQPSTWSRSWFPTPQFLSGALSFVPLLLFSGRDQQNLILPLPNKWSMTFGTDFKSEIGLPPFSHHVWTLEWYNCHYSLIYSSYFVGCVYCLSFEIWHKQPTKVQCFVPPCSLTAYWHGALLQISFVL